MSEKITRRTFITGMVGVAGSISATQILVGCGGGGSGSASPELPDPSRFAALIDGSVYDNTRRLFAVEDVFDPDHQDYFITKISRGGETLFSGNRLVFEINGEQRIGADDSARNTRVRAGDTISWKAI